MVHGLSRMRRNKLLLVTVTYTRQGMKKRSQRGQNNKLSFVFEGSRGKGVTINRGVIKRRESRREYRRRE
jgi:hypothetical protein